MSQNVLCVDIVRVVMRGRSYQPRHCTPLGTGGLGGLRWPWSSPSTSLPSSYCQAAPHPKAILGNCGTYARFITVCPMRHRTDVLFVVTSKLPLFERCAPLRCLPCRHSSSYQIPYEDLEVQDQIGGGGFSLVYRGFWKGTPVAIKKWFDPNHSEQMVQDFR